MVGEDGGASANVEVGIASVFLYIMVRVEDTRKIGGVVTGAAC
jgi:hypothetical protein